MNTPLTIDFPIQFRRGRRDAGANEAEAPPCRTSGASVRRLPRVSRLMALAIRFAKLVDSGDVKDYAQLARLGHVSRARITQLMNLTLLAPDIQEALLFLPPIESGRDLLHLRDLLPIAARWDWQVQRQLWGELQRKFS